MKKFIEEKDGLMFPLDLQLFAEDGGGSDDDTEDDADDEDEEEDEPKTFTQEQVNKMMAKEKRQGRLSVYKTLGIDPRNKEQVAKAKELLKGLGVPPADDKEDDSKQQKESLIDNQKLKEAEERAFNAECQVEAIKLGAKAKYVSDIILLVKARMSEGDEFAETLSEVKEMYPNLFGSDDSSDDDKEGSQEQNKKKKKDTGKSIGDFTKKRKGKDDGGKSLGARLAESRKASVKKSMFD